ncbi:MAG: polyphenol oxidase family protein [Candidatus Avelusimicrobium sp.]|uniref:polyphenol oxidase family protein n=1 Tax=Candidatus Avelusimicrobium sp. TaxID=3048833 RepID=UPI003F0FCEF8
MNIYADNRMLSEGLIGGTVSRHAGDMRQTANQNEVFGKLGIPQDKMLRFHQIHSDKIIRIASDADALSLLSRPAQDADAWIFSCGGWGGVIQTADCVPLFLWDETANVFALAHCGWRGVAAQLPYKTALAMKEAGAQGLIYAWAGPHIQSCCFEVQEDVARQFSVCSVIHKEGKIFVDLNAEISLQLQLAGLTAANLKTPYYCTCGDSENFFSWRRDHIRQNLLSFIYKP